MKKQLLLLLAATCIFAGLRAQSPVQRVFIQIDRDVYAPSGEVSFKAFLSKPADAAVKSSKLFVLILDPVGKPLVDKEFLVENNQAAGSLLLPDSTKEGEYRVLGYTDQMEYRPVTDAFSRKIMVRESKFPGLLIGLKLDASWYVRSESAQVGVHIVYQDGKPFKNGQFAYLASKNGVPYQNGISKTDEEGNDSFLIRIPATPEEGLLTLAVNTELGEFKGSSTISIPGGGIPVIMQFSPEGGTLIGGMSTVMGFRAGDIEGYPLKFEGVIVDRDNQPVDSIKSNSLGTGSIRFTPDPDDSLKVRISRPAGIDQLFPLPVAEPKGVQLLLKGRSESGLTFQVRTNIPRAGLRLSMTATYGGRSDVPVPFTLNDSLTWTVGVNQEIEGMVTVSIMNVEGVILAQRSVLVNPRNHRLSVSSGS
ncbi:MAG: MG2 domain-containing protein, partial [Bacteroidales bacterium]